MGVKVKLADKREIGGRAYAAGDVVDVPPAEARLLVTLGAGVKVDESPKASRGGAVPVSAPAGDVPNTKPGTARKEA